MKKSTTAPKLRLNAQTVRHLRELTQDGLRLVHGGMTTYDEDCYSHACEFSRQNQ